MEDDLDWPVPFFGQFSESTSPFVFEGPAGGLPTFPCSAGDDFRDFTLGTIPLFQDDFALHTGMGEFDAVQPVDIPSWPLSGHPQPCTTSPTGSEESSASPNGSESWAASPTMYGSSDSTINSSLWSQDQLDNISDEAHKPGTKYQHDIAKVPEWGFEHGVLEGVGGKHEHPTCHNHNATRWMQEKQNCKNKRTLTAAFVVPGSEYGGKKLPRREVGEKDTRLACPFYKHDPAKYRDCFSLKLVRIKDVKQHLRRRHKQAEYYCPRCHRVFDDHQLRDEHTRIASCVTLETKPRFEGMSIQQCLELKKDADRKLDVESQWVDMWRIIFPNQPPPSSPFAGTYMNELAPMLRNVWLHERLEIIDNLQCRQLTDDETGSLADKIVGAVLDRLESGTNEPTTPTGDKAQCWAATTTMKQLESGDLETEWL